MRNAGSGWSCRAAEGAVSGDSFRLTLIIFLLRVLAVSLASFLSSQTPPANPFQHYATARDRLAAGDELQATAEFQLFLNEVVHSLATATSKAGHPTKALPLFEEAISLSPSDAELRMEYARALFAVTRFRDALQQAQEAARLAPDNPQASLLVGQISFQLRDYSAARAQFEAVFAKVPDFATGYLLGKSCLLLHDAPAAQRVFDTMLREFGDTDVNRIFLGRAYSQAGYAEEAAGEFQRALGKNPKVLGAHYQLALSYLRDDEAAGYDKAIPEFRAELALNPDDFFSHYMLGYIAAKQSRWDEAEKELVRATTLNPKHLEAQLALADTYNAIRRSKDAEGALRKALDIAGTVTSREIARAHYLLGRVLLAQPDKQDEAKRELAIAAEMQKHSGTVLTADARSMGAGSVLREEAAAEAPTEKPENEGEPPGPGSHAADQLRATIADAYNNLGAIAGNAHDFASAASYFRRARQWNPELPGLDHNLGMALFSSNQFKDAAPLLKNYVANHADDVAARAALGFSLFRNEDYAGVVAALQPIQEQMAQTPKLAFAYAASLARTGNYEEGVRRLKLLEVVNRTLPDIHYELSLAYQHMGRSEDAIREMQTYQKLKK